MKFKKLENNYLANLENCDEEPIHLIGKVQENELLLAFDLENFQLTHFSEGLKNKLSCFFKTSKPKPKLEDLFNYDLLKEAEAFVKENSSNYLREHTESWQEDDYVIRFVKAKAFLILELEKFNRSENIKINSAIRPLENFSEGIERYKNLADIATNAVYYFRQLTKFDRVMFYKFHQNGDGEVIAEDKKVGLESFLGLRYPASDIPEQARKLYIANPIRTITDTNSEGDAIYSLQGQEMLDLSHSAFRSVSPIHLEYLRNMGVSASQSLSILANGKLWGMLICHHYTTPKRLNLSQFSLCKVFGSVISSWILSEAIRIKENTLRIGNQIDSELKENKSLSGSFKLLENTWPSLSKALNICGYAVRNQDDYEFYGDCPKKEVLIPILEDLQIDKTKSLFIESKEELGLVKSEEIEVAGLAAFTLIDKINKTVFLFRKEHQTEHKWAGKTSKDRYGKVSLSPRKSFDKWVEKVKGQSLTWSEADKVLVERLKESLIDVLLQQLEENEDEEKLKGLYEQKIKSLKIDSEEFINQHRILTAEYTKLKSMVLGSEQLAGLQQNVLSKMSHEMRTPLNGIMGLSDLLNTELEKTDLANKVHLQEYSRLIKESGDRMLKTFNRLLEIGKNSRTEVQLRMDNITLDQFFESVIDPLRPLAKKLNQKIFFQSHNTVNQIVTDELFLSQIISNLVQNAIKYAGKEASIEVGYKLVYEQEERILILEVHDDGNGIEKSEQTKIFEPFYSTKDLTKSADQSSGLGLYLVKSYVEFLGGKIELESDLGKGSSFKLFIPVEKVN